MSICLQCFTDFKTQDQLNQHILREHLIKCNKCIQRFKNTSDLNMHLHQHHNYKICRECNGVFVDASNLRKHIRRHTSYIICNICRIKFHGDPREFNRHNQQYHRNNAHPIIIHRPNIPCPYCIFTFANHNVLYDHIQNVHMASEQKYNNDTIRCEICEMPFPTMDILQQHLLSNHHDGRQHHCKKCGKVFPTQVELQLHSVTQHDINLTSSAPRDQCIIC